MNTPSTLDIAVRPTQRQPSGRMSSLVMDHPGWLRSHTRARRAFRTTTGTWVVACNQHGTALEPKIVPIEPRRPGEQQAVVDWFDITSLPPLLQAAKPFKYYSRVARYRNPDLWDALLQRILKTSEPHQRTKLTYRLLCLNYGTLFQTSEGVTLLPPTPEQILSLPHRAFSQMRLEHKGAVLRETAKEFLRRRSELSGLAPPAALVDQLRAIPHVSSWIARSAVADATNDLSVIELAEIMAHGRSARALTPKKCDVTTSEINDLAMSPAQRSTFVALVLAMQETVTKNGATRWADVASLNPDVP